MTSYQVKFWDIRKISDTARGRYRVRWSVAGRVLHTMGDALLRAGVRPARGNGGVVPARAGQVEA